MVRYCMLTDWFAPHYSNGFWARWMIMREAGKIKSDIYHITGDIHFVALVTPPSKTVLTVHDCGFLNHPNALLRRLYRHFWLTLPVHRVAQVTCVSEATKRHILSQVKVDPDKITVVPTLIDHRFVATRKDFNTSFPRVLQLGTKPNKNVPRLVKALSGLSVHLRIIGEPDEELMDLLQNNEVSYSIAYNLSFDELLAEYQMADIVSFCSTFEGFGMPIVEANAVGRVVLTSNCSSMPEVAGLAAHLVDPFSVDAIREGIRTLISDEALREQYIRAGFENAKRFQPDAVAQQYMNVYRRIHAS